MSNDVSQIDPASRIDLFRRRARELVAEARLPDFDHVVYDEARETLGFFWEHPRFLLGVDLRRSSIAGPTAEDLARAWARKFGGDWRARLRRGAIPREEPLPFQVGADGLSRSATR